MKKLLITGASGFLGWNICREACAGWETYGTFFTHPVEINGTRTVHVDLTDYGAMKKMFKEIKPDAVIHAAAAPDPNYCQTNDSASRKINIDATIHIAGLCADRDIPFVFTSTDLVFNGLHAPYREEDPVTPVNMYGEQKVLAEEGVIKQYPAASVCRMPLMFGNPGPAASIFFQSMVTALREGRELKLFIDEFRTPVSGRTAAAGLLLAVEKAQGILHLGGIERISRYQFGLLLMDVLGISEASLVRCTQKDMVMSAPRAPDLTLISTKAFALGYNPLPLRKQLRDTLNEEKQ